MRAKLINDGSEKTYALILESGEEAVSQLQRFARENKLDASRITAIGAFSSATLGYFNWESKDYEKIAINEQVEVLSLIGDIALQDGEPKIHAHVVVGKRDGSAHGGHLLAAYVRPTLEILLTESPGWLKRSYDAESGLALINADKE
ncbi:MAG TPA: PPC domain-containing DNA-binding protein [Oxalicibacterium sp.]